MVQPEEIAALYTLIDDPWTTEQRSQPPGDCGQQGNETTVLGGTGDALHPAHARQQM